MQGFNKYYPPDFDPRSTFTLNDARGVHALGKRAKDVDKGILVVRFELPWSIWCGGCNAHIGAGVRYNAQKRKVGNYYSTPIYAFRCKCHLCSAWFEIRTDPKNARYVIEEGARQVETDWDPEQEGGFAIFDTEKPSAAEPPVDAFAHLEKATDQKLAVKTKEQRLAELVDLSDRHTADPYAASQVLRVRFRERKKTENTQEAQDEALRSRLGLNIKLLEQDAQEGKEEWKRIREGSTNRASTSSKGRPRPADDLARVLGRNTRSKTISNLFDPESSRRSSSSAVVRSKALPTPIKSTPSKTSALVSYDSDDDAG